MSFDVFLFLSPFLVSICLLYKPASGILLWPMHENLPLVPLNLGHVFFLQLQCLQCKTDRLVYNYLWMESIVKFLFAFPISIFSLHYNFILYLIPSYIRLLVTEGNCLKGLYSWLAGNLVGVLLKLVIAIARSFWGPSILTFVYV